MSMNTLLSIAAADAALDALSILAADGYLRIYDGRRPGLPEEPVSGQRLLAELRFRSPAFAKSAGGRAIANDIRDDDFAKDTGNAAWCRAFAQDGSTPICDADVGTMDSSIVMNSTQIQVGARVSVSSLALIFPVQIP